MTQFEILNKHQVEMLLEVILRDLAYAQRAGTHKSIQIHFGLGEIFLLVKSIT